MRVKNVGLGSKPSYVEPPKVEPTEYTSVPKKVPTREEIEWDKSWKTAVVWLVVGCILGGLVYLGVTSDGKPAKGPCYNGWIDTPRGKCVPPGK